jgi:pyruvate dehydrogenase E1 component beta subunit
MYSAIPGLKVVTPFTPYEAKGLLKSAIRDDDPVLIMESEKMYGDKGLIPDGEFLVPIGKANVRQKGSDVTIVSFGKILKTVHAAAEELAKEDIEVEIIDLITIRPLDLDTIIESIKKTNRLVIVEESFPVSSVSSEVSYRVQRNAFDYLDAPIIRICQSDTPYAFATTLIEEATPQIKEIVDAVKTVTYIN